MTDLDATSLVSPLPVRMETEGDTSEKVKVDNMDYSVVLVEGQERFACNQCEFKADKSGSMKRHITTKHVTARLTGQGRKRKSMESGKVESNSKEVRMDEGLSESIMEGLGKDFTSTQVEMEDDLKFIKELEDDRKVDGENDEIEEENEGGNAVEMEEKYEEEKRKNAVLQGKVNALEEIKDKQKQNMDRMKKIVTDYKTDLDKARAGKGGAETAKVKKELKEAKASISELQKKVEKLTTDKAKAEAEVARLMKHNNHMEEALDRTRRPEAMQRVTKDCPFWMEGFCSYTEAECNKGKHKKEKFNTRQRRGAVNEEKIVSNVLEALSKQQRPQMGQQQQQAQHQNIQQMRRQPQMMMPDMMTQQQQPMMMMQPQQQMGPQYQQQLGFRPNTAGMQWSSGNQQDFLDMSMAGSSGAANYRFPQ